MKKILPFIVVGILLAGGVFWYVTRPTKGPSGQDGTSIQVPAVPGTDEKVVVDEGSSVREVEGQVPYSITTGSAEFRIDEKLRGEPKHVIGKTDVLSGDIFINADDLASSAMGEIRINARTLQTDDGNRDNMLRRFILKTEDDANEYIVFRPTKIQGLSGALVLGEKKVFTILGNMTVAGVTKPVPFDVEATFTEGGTLDVHASALVKYTDFGITIPEVPFVANVSENVFIVLTFSAGGK